MIHKDDNQNKVYLQTGVLRQHGGLILVFGFALLFALFTLVAENILVNIEYQAEIFQLLSFLISSVFFLVYLLISKTLIIERRRSLLVIIISSLVLGFVFLSYGGTTWVWFSPLFLFQRITHAIGGAASIPAASLIDFTTFIICSVFYYLIASFLLCTKSVIRRRRKDIRLILVVSFLFSLAMLVLSWSLHEASLADSIYTVVSVFFEAALFSLLFHIIYVRIANNNHKALIESEIPKTQET